jgi:hypothetical protein
MPISGCSFANLPTRNYQPAAHCNADFDIAAVALGTKPRRRYLKQGRGWYWEVAVALSSGRFGTLCKWEDFPATIEVSLELVRDEYFSEEDLQEVLAVLNVEVKDSARQGAFKWKSKR